MLHLSDIHPQWHFTTPRTAIRPVKIGQLLLLNPGVIKSKGHPKGSQNKRETNTSTHCEPSGFEVEAGEQEQQCVLHP